MDDSVAYAKRLEAKYQNEASDPPEGIVAPDLFCYMHFKAFVFLTLGPDEYRTLDAFQRPPENLPEATLDAIRRGCEQIFQWRGLAAGFPLEDIGVGGFYALLDLFHFQHVAHASASESSGAVLDQMQMKHGVDGREITLYNRVVSGPGFEKRETGTCPYCGKSLRTEFAKQCRHCKKDWHDPEKINPL